ncbi:MAG: hypothetical protein AAGL34_17320 [Bacteroidota bacterium]
MLSNSFYGIVFFFISILGFSQGQYLENLGSRYGVSDSKLGLITDYEGSPYLNDEFVPAKVEGLNTTQLVRFNAYDDEMEIRVDGNKVYKLPNPKSVRVVLLDDSRKVYLLDTYPRDEGVEQQGFFELIHEGEGFLLLLKERMKFLREVKAEAYQKAEPARFKKAKEVFYIKQSNFDEYQEVPSKQKAFLKLFPAANVKTVKSTIKGEKLKLSDAEDVASLFSRFLKP